ncbi:MAG: sodium:solute symporter [Phycisphaerae bacterium]|nr:sodium:solute symporter [Phycisphaerae bacterium]MBM92747.1 sodium:solute symporter [Phycisphaerae bacterium]
MLTIAQSSGSGGFGIIDLAVVSGYFLLLAITGALFARHASKNSRDYFLGSRSMPSWAVAISIVATSLSAVTFIGAPEQAYKGDLTYLATNIGMVIAAIIIALVFIPAFYRSGSASIYELLEERFGPVARKSASITFLIGRVLASGARVYAGAIPAAIVLFGFERGNQPIYLMGAIAVLAFVGIIYTLAGGIRSVIWSDVIQFTILIGAALCAIVLIVVSFNAPLGEVLTALRTGGEGGTSKLTLLDLSFDWQAPFSLPACIIGFTLLGIGSYGTDQDLAQRMLTCKDAKQGARSVIVGILLGIPSVSIFLTLGLLLWVLYQRPELTSVTDGVPPEESMTIFLHYILTQIPPGVRGLMMAGLFAAGLSSLNSAINAMSAAFISDLYEPIMTRRRGKPLPEQHLVRVGQIGVIAGGIVLGLFACVCIFWKNSNNDTLIVFALSVMSFAYAGLIGVFFCALLTKRGSSASVIAALIVGFVWMLMTQRFVYDAIPRIHGPRIEYFYGINFTWKLTIGVLLSTSVCALGRPQSKASIAAPEAA